MLRARTATGTDLGVAYMYERSFAVANVANPATNSFVPIFAVKEQNGSAPVHLLIRLLYTGTPAPCPLYYGLADCSGAPLGMNPVSATGFACSGHDGHAWRADPTAPLASVSQLSFEAARFDGTDFVRVCTNATATVPALPVQDLGLSDTVGERVYMQPAD